jgi:L-histidine N-alpha-methyltransferase
MNPLDLEPRVTEFAAEIVRDLQLQPKRIQSKFLYDALGSSLFDAICHLPWYPITRAEHRLLARHGGDVVRMLARQGSSVHLPTIVELGCGTGEKLAQLGLALQERGGAAHVHLIDVSSHALERTTRRLVDLPHLTVASHHATYDAGLREATLERGDGPLLVLFLGSNIGNFDALGARTLLRHIHSALRPGDLLLLGADLIKPPADLLLAYDDPLGVTSAFNRNLLVRINRELQANFDVSAFAHVAVWNRDERCVEMHLASGARQDVTIRAADIVISIDAGEWIWTESSHKYEPDEIETLCGRSGFAMLEQWLDQDARFALTLAAAE